MKRYNNVSITRCVLAVIFIVYWRSSSVKSSEAPEAAVRVIARIAPPRSAVWPGCESHREHMLLQTLVASPQKWTWIWRKRAHRLCCPAGAEKVWMVLLADVLLEEKCKGLIKKRYNTFSSVLFSAITPKLNKYSIIYVKRYLQEHEDRSICLRIFLHRAGNVFVKLNIPQYLSTLSYKNVRHC